MGVRQIVRIDEEKCDGCALCVQACAERAIQIIDGKARLVSETYCDGLGACLGECPQGAITIERREAPEFDESAVRRHLATLEQPSVEPLSAAPEEACACPGSAMHQFEQPARDQQPGPLSAERSRLSHWPVQLKLVPPAAPFLKGADILICADCVPFAVPDFHHRFLAGRAVIVGCPKLDDLQYYYLKLKDIFAEAAPRTVTVLKMEVPCCNGIARAALQACNEVVPEVPTQVYTIGIRGEIRREKLPAGKDA